MAHRRQFGPWAGPFDLDAVLHRMSAAELRDLVRAMLPLLGAREQADVVEKLLDRAARSGSIGMPDGPSAETVAAIVTFAVAAERDGDADPAAVDHYLREGSNAVRVRDYATAVEIFRALLVPVSTGDIYCGQAEMGGHALVADLTECAARYVVSVYMTSDPEQRANDVWAAIGALGEAGRLWLPLQEIERGAVEPLPGFEDFLSGWRALLEDATFAADSGDWESDEDRWLREVVQRLDGIDGLAERARATRRAEDLRSWCDALVEAADWKTALVAYGEAAEFVTDKALWRGEFLDGAALAAQETGRSDLPARLEAAWRGAPSALRLRRWLGSAKSKAVARKRAAEALDACPKRDRRQRALLHLVLGDHVSGAKLLASAPGLGWSDSGHPGHLLFPLFQSLLGGAAAEDGPDPGPMTTRGMDIEELEWITADRDRPRLSTPDVDEILQLAGVRKPASATERKAVCVAMRAAAKKRVAGVTSHKRRRYYGHAASLVAACVEIDTTPECVRWVTKLRADYSRFPALRRELDARLGPSG